MSILKIIQLESGAFKHNDSIDGDFFLGRFSFKEELNKAFLAEAYGAKKRSYAINEIEVYAFEGVAESFTNFTDLENRLVELNYTGIDTNGMLPMLNFIPLAGTEVGKPITGDIEFQGERFLISNGIDGKYSSLILSDDASVTMQNNDGTFQQNFGSTSELLGFLIASDNPSSRGLISNQDFSANITDFDYVQKIYVDNLMSGGGGGGTAKRTYYAEWKITGAMAASTNWYSLGAFNNLRDAFSAIAGLTPTNNFANTSIQAPCYILPFNAKIKSYNIRGFTNGNGNATLRSVVGTSFTPVGNQTTIQNALNVADVSFQLNNQGITFRFQTDSTGLTTTTLPKGTEIRLYNFNNNQNTPLQSTIISIEFEEVI